MRVLGLIILPGDLEVLQAAKEQLTVWKYESIVLLDLGSKRVFL
jgi:hypothetical protein